MKNKVSFISFHEPSQAPVGEPLDRTIYPPETQRLFHHLDVRYRRPFGALPAVCHHPAATLFVVVFLEPSTQFLTRGVV